MAIGESIGPINATYFTSMAARAEAATSCAEIQALNISVNASVGFTLSGITDRLGEMTTQLGNMSSKVTNLYAHIGTLAAESAAHSTLITVSATASGVSDLNSAIAFIHAHGAATGTVGTTSVAKLVQKILDLNSEYTQITHMQGLLTAQVGALTSQVSGLTSQLGTLQGVMDVKVALFPGCSF